MDFTKIINGLAFLVGGLCGNVWRRSAMDKKNKGTNYSSIKIIYSSWGLIIAGIALIILGLLNNEE